MDNRKASALIQIVLIYLIIALSGCLTYAYLDIENDILRFLAADVNMTIVCFIFSILKKNSSTYDAYWSVIPFYFVMLLSYLHFNHLTNNHILIFLVVSIWSWRLTLNWIRSWKDFRHEDWRYVMLQKKHGKAYQLVNFSGIHLFPTLLVFASMWPLFFIFDQNLQVHWIFYTGLFISLLGTLFEYLADNQLSSFRKSPNRKTEDLLDTGIWSYSRNPNYLGEILFWSGIYLIGYSFGAPYYTGIGFLSMLFLFVFISIPMKEERMLTRRPKFKDYQEKVSMLLLWPRKKNNS